MAFPFAALVRLCKGGGAAPVDTRAPLLTSPVDTADGTSAADLSVITDEAGGLLFWYVSTSATPPTAAQLKNGAGAVAFSNQPVNVIGSQAMAPTGLTANTQYYSYFLHRDAAGNDSLIAAANGFATDPETPGFAPDYTVHNWSELNALLTGATDLSHKGVLVAGDCAGAQITVSGKTWPGAIIRGTDASTRPIMPRLKFVNCNGASDGQTWPNVASTNRIQFRYLDFYNVATIANSSSGAPYYTPNSEGQITFETTNSSWFEFDACKFHDDPFSTKNFRTTSPNVGTLYMFWGFSDISDSAGKCHHLWIHDCEIYNQRRSIFRGDYVRTERNNWHDYYLHMATLTGSHHVHRNSTGQDLWAAYNDTNQPHAGVAFSPSPPIGGADVTDIQIEGIIAITGTARRRWSIANGVTDPGEWNGLGSGIKFNDASQANANYVNCTVRNCLLVGNDSLLINFDASIDCVVEFCTLVYDRFNYGSEPIAYFQAPAGPTTMRHCHVYTVSRGTTAASPNLKLYGNVSCASATTGASALNAYENTFVGLPIDADHPTAFSGISSIAEALACFAPNPSHPSSSWAIKPGAMNYYDWDTGVGSWPATAQAVSNNATAHTPALVTKPATAWNQTALATSGNGVWKPANKRKGTIIHRFATDSDTGSRNLFTCSGNMGFIQKLPGTSKGTIRTSLRNTSSVNVLSDTSTIGIMAASGVCFYVHSWDLDQAKDLFAVSINGQVYTDFPTITAMLSGQDWGIGTNALQLIFGASSTSGGSASSGTEDVFFLEDQFLDIETDAGFSKVFNTSGGLPDLGANGENVFGSTPGIFLKGNAAAWNGSSFNLGDAVGSAGGATATTFAKAGAGAYA